MNIKTVTYPDGRTYSYDADAPCHWCGLPVVEASMGGTGCCPWCDMGTCRFDRSHRVDTTPYNPASGKQFPPSYHYEHEHPAEWAARPSSIPDRLPAEWTEPLP